MATLTQEIAAHDTVTSEDIQLLSRASGPCVTILAYVRDPLELSTKLKNAMSTADRQLQATGKGEYSPKELLEPVWDLAGKMESAHFWCNALAVFRSPELLRYFVLYRRIPEIVRVEGRFQVRPLLAALAREQRFRLLGLSRGRIRLLHCTPHRAEDESLRSLAPEDFNAWLNTRQPDHVLDNRSTAGPSVGSMKGVSFGTSTDRDRADESLAHFYKAVDKGVNTLLRNDPTRLMLAGTETEIALYRRVTSYPRLFEKHVHGSAEGLSDTELHSRAVDLASKEPSDELGRALADYAKRQPGRTSSDPREIVKAAFEGRVSDLFVAAGAELYGTWNEETHEVDTTRPDEELLNAAALRTALHGGRAFELEAEEMPAPRDAVAVLRY